MAVCTAAVLVGLLQVFCYWGGSSASLFGTRSSIASGRPDKPSRRLNPTFSGYLPVNNKLGSDLFYTYFEAREPDGGLDKTPIVLWLQGGPGCSSLFGMLYINGPYFINEDLTLRRNPGAWNRKFGLLFIEQPVGVGFSLPGRDTIPSEELSLASQLYEAIQTFYRLHRFYDRPLVVTGESYAGKYVPSISHYILQVDAMSNRFVDKLTVTRKIPADVDPPVFKLGALAIGNGFTDALTQTMHQASIAWSMGLIDTAQREIAEGMQNNIVALMETGRWAHAAEAADALNGYITNCSHSASLEDIRRNKAYDGDKLVDKFLNLPEVKQELGIHASIQWASCSPVVGKIMRPDVMRSVHHLVPDLIAYHPVLIYLGQFDAECGVASNDAWLNKMAWPGHIDWLSTPRKMWMNGSEPLGYVKQLHNLTQIVVRNAGHMVPHDRPLVALSMLETWLDTAPRHKPFLQ